jgi:DNA-binding transcriptional LysR family regulator
MSINLELLDLRAFLAVYEFRSFREAADLLHLSQPALSRRVQGLEGRLRVALFERSTRHVLPTAAGRTFEPMARRLLEELDTLADAIGGGGDQQSGLITIAALPSAASYFLPRLFKKFMAKFPHTRLRVLDRLVAEGFECVIRGEAEFGINVSDPTETDLTFSHLLDDPYVFVCHREHPLAGKRRINWEDLRGHPLIGIGRAADSGNRALFDEALSKARLRLDWLYEVYSFSTALRLIEGGVGSSIMPRLGVPGKRGSNLVAIPIGPVPLTRSIGIIERRKGRLSPPAKFLRNMLIVHCGGTVANEVSQPIAPLTSGAKRAAPTFAQAMHAQ